MPFTTLLLCALALAGLAVPFSMVGLGGGATYVPILLLAGMDTPQAISTSLFIIAVASLAAVPIYHRRGVVDWKLLAVLAPCGVVGSVLGGYVSVSAEASVIKITFAAVLIATAGLMLRPVQEGRQPAVVSGFIPWQRTCGGHVFGVQLGLLIPTAVAIGFLSALIGVGGGSFLIPVLTLLFGCPIRVAIGVSSAYIGATAIFGLAGHLAGGSDFSLVIALPLALAAFIGAKLGPVLSARVQVKHLRQILAGILAGLAVWMVFQMVAG